MPRYRRRQGPDDVITAEEIACWAYCPEQWRLSYGLGLPPINREALQAGIRHHSRKEMTERIAGVSIMLGRFLVVLAAVLLLLQLWWRL